MNLNSYFRFNTSAKAFKTKLAFPILIILLSNFHPIFVQLLIIKKQSIQKRKNIHTTFAIYFHWSELRKSGRISINIQIMSFICMNEQLQIVHHQNNS